MKKESNNKIEKFDIIIFGIIILILGTILLGFTPALMTSDNVDQIYQARTETYSSGHPIFHTFLIGNMTKLFNSATAPVIFQIIIFAIIWSLGCKVCRENNNSNLNKVFQIIFTVLICIMPINFLYSITLWKDILYSYSILGALICIYIGIKHNYNFTIIQIILIALSSICIMKFRHNGVPIGFFIFVVLMLLNFIKIKKIKITSIFLGSFLFIYILTSIPGWIYLKKDGGIQSAGGALTCTKVYCMGALLNQDIELENEEKEFLNQILNIDEWKNGYYEYSGGNILFNPNLHFSVLDKEENMERFNNIFNKYAKQKKKILIKHFVLINSIWWSPYEFAQMNSVVVDNTLTGNVDKGEFETTPVLDFVKNGITSLVNKTLSHRLIYIALYRPAVPMIVALIGVSFIIIKRKKIGYLLIVLPMLLNIGTYIFIMSSQDARYFYPNNITGYFVILILGELYCKARYSKKTEKLKNKGNKTLVIVPAYNEQDAIKNTVEKIYEQNTNVDVIVINDGSKDNTYNEAKKTKAIVIDAPNNLGIGGAVQTGYLYAYKNNYDIAIQVDGDGQHNPKYIAEMVKILVDEDVDMVIGSRFVEKTSYDQTFFRMLGINITSGLINLFTDKKIHDTTSGFRAVNKSIIKCFAENYPYDYPEPVTTMQMILKNKIIKEIPVEMNQRTTGVSSISPLKSVSYMIKVSLSLILNGFREN